MKPKLFAVLTFLVMLVVLITAVSVKGQGDDLVFQAYVNQPLELIKIRNVVTSVYLDFRLFDTIFEALLLLVSIGAIFIFTSLNENEKRVPGPTFNLEDLNLYRLPKVMLSVVYPLLFLLGTYMIINGADSPGGGFQGGAILASVLMSRYLVQSQYDYDYRRPYRYEKVSFVLVLLLALLYLTGWIPKDYLRHYILAMNLLIAMKVGFGFSAIFIKFMDGTNE